MRKQQTNRRKVAKEKSTRNTQMKRHTCSDTQKSHKIRKPETIIYMQKTCKRERERKPIKVL